MKNVFAAIISGGPLPKTSAGQGTITKVLTITFVIVGALALLFMVIAGTRYALSKGEPENIQKAKNEIKYSAIGLIIAFLAVAIVNFVIGKL